MTTTLTERTHTRIYIFISIRESFKLPLSSVQFHLNLLMTCTNCGKRRRDRSTYDDKDNNKFSQYFSTERFANTTHTYSYIYIFAMVLRPFSKPNKTKWCALRVSCQEYRCSQTIMFIYTQHINVYGIYITHMYKIYITG